MNIVELSSRGKVIHIICNDNDCKIDIANGEKKVKVRTDKESKWKSRKWANQRKPNMKRR